MKTNKFLAEPPEGVIAGEDVPLENQQEDFKEKEIEEMMGRLKSIGRPFSEMKKSELREKAINRLEEIK